MPTGFGIDSYDGGEGYIFVSYAPEDENRIMPLVHEMYRRGHRISFDDGLLSSEEKCRIIDNAAVVILFVTPNAIGSQRIEKEMQIAAENKLPAIAVYFGVDAEQHPSDQSWRIKRSNIINGGKGTNFIIDVVEKKMLGCARKYTKDAEIKNKAAKPKHKHYSKTIIVGIAMVVISAAFAITMLLMSFDWSAILPKRAADESTVDDSFINKSISDVSTGDIITMGVMEQDGNEENGEEPLSWQVVDIEGNKVLLVCVNSVCYMSYYERSAEISWQDCTLRTYLNNTFYRHAFSEKERSGIILSHIDNNRNQRTDVSGGEKTNDYVFCLSLSEVESYFPDPQDRLCMPTMAAMLETYGKKTASIGDMWWMRSPGKSRGHAAYVKSLGSIDYFGSQVDIATIGVRPAMWVELD